MQIYVHNKHVHEHLVVFVIACCWFAGAKDAEKARVANAGQQLTNCVTYVRS